MSHKSQEKEFRLRWYLPPRPGVRYWRALNDSGYPKSDRVAYGGADDDEGHNPECLLREDAKICQGQ